MAKTIVVSGGGTAGHIYPALALAERLQKDGYDVKFAGTPNSLESKLVPEAGIEFMPLEASGFDRAKPWTLITGSIKIAKSTRKARRWFREITPVCVVGFGGYVSIPVTRAAEEMGIPVVVHEQNSVMGMANRYIATRADAVCLTYPVDEPEADTPKWQIVGNPVRSQVLDATREEGRRYLGIEDDPFLLVVFGGSLGAKHLNKAIADIKDDLLKNPKLHVVHMTGKGDFENALEELALTDEQKSRWHVKAYESQMGLVLAAADACISRAGATSLAEIAARAVPAVLVPYPYARGNHQMLNAKSYADAGAAIVVADENVETDEFKDAVMQMVDTNKCSDMRALAQSLGADDAAGKLARVVESCIKK